MTHRSTDDCIPALLGKQEKTLRKEEMSWYKVHDAILDSLGPLCGLWQALRDERLSTNAGDIRDVYVSAADIMPAIQRAIVFSCSAASSVWSERRRLLLKQLSKEKHLIDQADELPKPEGKLFGPDLLTSLKKEAKFQRVIADVKSGFKPKIKASQVNKPYRSAGQSSYSVRSRFLGRGRTPYEHQNTYRTKVWLPDKQFSPVNPARPGNDLQVQPPQGDTSISTVT